MRDRTSPDSPSSDSPSPDSPSSDAPSSDSRWWSRSRGLPQPAYQAWRSALAEVGLGPARILAWARTPEAYCIGSPAVLSWGERSWQHVGWHQIQHGEWNEEPRQLRWREVGQPGERGRRETLTLVEPGRLPELFRERIAASILLERRIPVSGDRAVILTARRPLAGDAAISWQASLTRGLTWQTPGVRETADQGLAELQAEYDFG